MTLTIVNLQNATSTPGDSALFTNVELSENAMTSPTTASAPHVLGLRARGCVVEWGGVMRFSRAYAARPSVRPM
jgi:hypothetical protein